MAVAFVWLIENLLPTSMRDHVARGTSTLDRGSSAGSWAAVRLDSTDAAKERSSERSSEMQESSPKHAGLASPKEIAVVSGASQTPQRTLQVTHIGDHELSSAKNAASSQPVLNNKDIIKQPVLSKTEKLAASGPVAGTAPPSSETPSGVEVRAPGSGSTPSPGVSESYPDDTLLRQRTQLLARVRFLVEESSIDHFRECHRPPPRRGCSHGTL